MFFWLATWCFICVCKAKQIFFGSYKTSDFLWHWYFSLYWDVLLYTASISSSWLYCTDVTKGLFKKSIFQWTELFCQTVKLNRQPAFFKKFNALKECILHKFVAYTMVNSIVITAIQSVFLQNVFLKSVLFLNVFFRLYFPNWQAAWWVYSVKLFQVKSSLIIW